MFKRLRTLFSKQKDLKDRELVITNNSQSHVLQCRMQHEAGMTHDEKALVDLHGIRVRIQEKEEGDKAVLYFCGLTKITPKEMIKKGDGGLIPEDAVLKNVQLPASELMHGKRDGYYNLKNVVLHSNGVISVEATPATVWEPLD